MSLTEYFHYISSADVIMGSNNKAFNNKYGFIQFKNPNYMQDYDDNANADLYDYTSEYMLRKPTPAERREIIVNTIIECNGRSFSIPKLAKMLAVSDRTLQNCLRQLERESIIKITPRYGKNGVRKSNSYRYIGEQCAFYGNGLTLKTLYDFSIDYGFRNWAWKDNTFLHNGKWHNQYGQCYMKFRAHVKKREYLEKHNLPLIVPEPIKYLTLRYIYWKGDYHIDETDRLTRESTVKIALNSQNYKTVNIGGFKLLLLFTNGADNPKVKVYDIQNQEKIATFTWFSINIAELERRLNVDDIEQVLILGDFTTK